MLTPPLRDRGPQPALVGDRAGAAILARIGVGAAFGRSQSQGSGTILQHCWGRFSPLLSNLFLHYVLDQWFDKEVRPRLKGEAFLIRYADDFVIGAAREDDARRIMDVLPKRMSKYGLTVHPEKTRLIRFQPEEPHDPETAAEDSSSPKTFDFLGFTHFWGKSRGGVWVIKRKTARSRLKRALQALSEWCRQNRHEPILVQHQAEAARPLRVFRNHGQLLQPSGIPGGRAEDLEAMAVAAPPRRIHVVDRFLPPGETLRLSACSSGPQPARRRSDMR